MTPGNRVPMLLIGPHVKKGPIDSIACDTASIFKMVTRRFGLEPLPGVRVDVGDLSAVLD